jgi:DNA (cytosine-5)-methyltransferase 1
VEEAAAVRGLRPARTALAAPDPRRRRPPHDAGGAAVGYHRAGFDVIGVDINPQPRYPFEFIEYDGIQALQSIAEYGPGRYAAIHASPPCQRYAGTYQDHTHHPDLIPEVRQLLTRIGLPYVIENIATAPLPDAIVLCGATFGLPIIWHRKFETSWDFGLVESACPQRSWGRAVTHGPGYYPYARKKWRENWRDHVLPVVWPWMRLEEAGQAIPPAYTEYIGRQLLGHLRERGA